jgi:excisionase family DNA binding protein
MKKTKNSKRVTKMTAASELTIADRSLLNVKETAQFLRISQSLLWKEIKAGNLKPVRIGDRVLFSRSYLERFCEGEVQ